MQLFQENRVDFRQAFVRVKVFKCKSKPQSYFVHRFIQMCFIHL